MLLVLAHLEGSARYARNASNHYPLCGSGSCHAGAELADNGIGRYSSSFDFRQPSRDGFAPSCMGLYKHCHREGRVLRKESWQKRLCKSSSCQQLKSMRRPHLLPVNPHQSPLVAKACQVAWHLAQADQFQHVARVSGLAGVIKELVHYGRIDDASRGLLLSLKRVLEATST
eukprot:TRINITY_DN9634_c0_g1_i3.p1 TRINITY_DN9634_c0_g1~~TRINITY_DN9634_c0_g1_i3.p1  ORF type:complete len:172 (+),score=23.01 TRINITY_DN9634_c0_g1_i3:516-1031(+)